MEKLRRPRGRIRNWGENVGDREGNGGDWGKNERNRKKMREPEGSWEEKESRGKLRENKGEWRRVRGNEGEQEKIKEKLRRNEGREGATEGKWRTVRMEDEGEEMEGKWGGRREAEGEQGEPKASSAASFLPSQASALPSHSGLPCPLYWELWFPLFSARLCRKLINGWDSLPPAAGKRGPREGKGAGWRGGQGAQQGPSAWSRCPVGGRAAPPRGSRAQAQEGHPGTGRGPEPSHAAGQERRETPRPPRGKRRGGGQERRRGLTPSHHPPRLPLPAWPSAVPTPAPASLATRPPPIGRSGCLSGGDGGGRRRPGGNPASRREAVRLLAAGGCFSAGVGFRFRGAGAGGGGGVAGLLPVSDTQWGERRRRGREGPRPRRRRRRPRRRGGGWGGTESGFARRGGEAEEGKRPPPRRPASVKPPRRERASERGPLRCCAQPWTIRWGERRRPPRRAAVGVGPLGAAPPSPQPPPRGGHAWGGTGPPLLHRGRGALHLGWGPTPVLEGEGRVWLSPVVLGGIAPRFGESHALPTPPFLFFFLEGGVAQPSPLNGRPRCSLARGGGWQQQQHFPQIPARAYLRGGVVPAFLPPISGGVKG